MDRYEFRRHPVADSRPARPRTPIERPDRIALWAVALSLVAMVAGVASADAGSGGASYEPADFDDAPTQLATWYGPGFYGEKTACGQTLTRRTIGVAHRRLPCGTKVAFSYKGRSLETEVIDRGPYGTRAKWDLTQRAAERLGLDQTDEVRVVKLGKRH
jgi:rare lipoprotein A (peptidoglycan hydrolase)